MDPYDHDLERGMRNRRALLGDAWVDKSVANATTFTADFQNFITRYAWHDIWSRPALDWKTRRVVVLSITCALGRWEEFELHTRAALTGGAPAEGASPVAALTPEEVREVLMQAAIYAGVPAANTAMSIVARLLRELGRPAAPCPATDVGHPGTGRSLRTATAPHLHYTLREPRQAPAEGALPRTVVFSHALGADHSLWDEAANALAVDCRVVTYDHRGHGDSDTPPGPYTLAELADDAARLIAEVQARSGSGDPVAWVGLSMGGMVGQQLALTHPGLVSALVLANTTSAYDTAARAQWRTRIATVERDGLEAIADGTMQRWFTPAFHATQAATVARWRRRVVTTPLAGYLASCEALASLDLTAQLGAITVPTLVIAGRDDEATPPALSETLTAGIPGAELQVMPRAAHLSVIEQPASFIARLRGFLGATGR